MKKKYEEYVSICKLLEKEPYAFKRWRDEYRAIACKDL